MNALLDRVVLSIRRDGLGGTGAKLKAAFDDLVFDLRYGVETRHWRTLESLDVVGDSKSHGRMYQATRVSPLRRLLRDLRPLLDPDDVFVDFGCGKGRTMLLAAEAGFRSARGVEFAAELCRAARANCSAFVRRTGSATLFAVAHADAAEHPIAPDETVFFMFNPFDATIMRRVHANILASAAAHPRRMLMLYHMPHGARASEPPGWRTVQSFAQAGGDYVAFANC